MGVIGLLGIFCSNSGAQEKVLEKCKESGKSSGTNVGPCEETRALSAVEKFDGFIARFFTSLPSLSLIVAPIDDGVELDLLPNSNLNAGMGLSYAGWGGTLSTRLADESEQQFGSTEYYDFQFYYYSKRFMIMCMVRSF